MSRKLKVFQAEEQLLSALAWPTDRSGQDLGVLLMSLLLEEAGELSQAVRCCGKARWGHSGEGPGTEEKVLDELGDCLFLLSRTANLFSLSLEDAAERVLRKIEGRIELGKNS